MDGRYRDVRTHRHESAEETLTGNNDLVDDGILHTLSEVIIDQVEHEGGGESMRLLFEGISPLQDACGELLNMRFQKKRVQPRQRRLPLRRALHSCLSTS